MIWNEASDSQKVTGLEKMLHMQEHPISAPLLIVAFAWIDIFMQQNHWSIYLLKSLIFQITHCCSASINLL